MSGTLTLPRSRPERVAAANPWRRGHLVAVVAIALVQGLMRVMNPMGDDMLWGARFGWDALTSGQLPRTDTWSWTATGHEFVANSWAWNVVLGISYHAFGVYGFWLIVVAMSLALGLAVAKVAMHYAVRPTPVLTVYAFLGAVPMVVAPRAQLLSDLAVLMVPLLAARLMRANDRDTVLVRLAQIGLFELVWINLHEGGLLGPVLFGATTLAIAVGTTRTSPFRTGLLRAVAAGAVSTLACLATPYGLTTITHASHVRDASAGFINEWAPAGFSSGTAIADLVGAVLGLLLAVWCWRRGRFAVAACTLVLAIASFTAIRFLPELVVVAMPELALLISRLRIRDALWLPLAGFGVTVCLALVVSGARDPGQLGPDSSVALVRALPQDCRLFNDDIVGDAVILLRPDVKVSLDGRNDMYGRAVLQQLVDTFQGGAAADRWLDAHHVTCVLAPTTTKLVRQLANDGGWTVRGTDAERTLLVRS